MKKSKKRRNIAYALENSLRGGSQISKLKENMKSPAFNSSPAVDTSSHLKLDLNEILIDMTKIQKQAFFP